MPPLPLPACEREAKDKVPPQHDFPLREWGGRKERKEWEGERKIRVEEEKGIIEKVSPFFPLPPIRPPDLSSPPLLVMLETFVRPFLFFPSSRELCYSRVLQSVKSGCAEGEGIRDKDRTWSARTKVDVDSLFVSLARAREGSWKKMGKKWGRMEMRIFASWLGWVLRRWRQDRHVFSCAPNYFFE